MPGPDMKTQKNQLTQDLSTLSYFVQLSAQVQRLLSLPSLQAGQSALWLQERMNINIKSKTLEFQINQLKWPYCSTSFYRATSKNI